MRAARPFYGWIIVAALGVTTIVSYGTNQYLYGLLLDPLAREQGWSRDALSAGYAGSLLLGGLAGIAFGAAVDRYGARALPAAGTLLNAFSLLALARTHDVAAFDTIWRDRHRARLRADLLPGDDDGGRQLVRANVRARSAC